MKYFFIITIFLGQVAPAFCFQQTLSVQDPPEKIRLLERIESSKWLHLSSKWMLKNHSMNLIKKEEIETIASFNKDVLIHESEIGTAGILLFEFATGEGPSTRYFNKSDSFTQSFIRSPGMQYVLSQYTAQYDSLACFDSTLNLYNYRYQFSPMLTPLDLTTWDFSLTQHLATWDSKNFSQIIIGSFNVDIQYKTDSTIQVHAWNKTSKKSLFLGLGKRWQRPLPLGTIDQHFVFELNVEEVLTIAR